MLEDILFRAIVGREACIDREDRYPAALRGKEDDMNDTPESPKPSVNQARKDRKESAAEERQVRLAEALRDNLRRRKGQARDRRDG